MDQGPSGCAARLVRARLALTIVGLVLALNGARAEGVHEFHFYVGRTSEGYGFELRLHRFSLDGTDYYDIAGASYGTVTNEQGGGAGGNVYFNGNGFDEGFAFDPATGAFTVMEVNPFGLSDTLVTGVLGPSTANGTISASCGFLGDPGPPRDGIECLVDGSFTAFLQPVVTLPSVGFSRSNYYFREGSRFPESFLELVKSGISEDGTVAGRVEVTAQDGTAVFGNAGDYTLARNFPFPLRPAVFPVFVDVRNDLLAEAPETFTVGLANPDAYVQIAPGAQATVTIFDDDIPDGPYLVTPQVPGYRFKVRIGGTRLGTLVGSCLAETMCVAGALPTRSEVLLRVIGPRPNGYFWPMVLRFTPASVEVWVEREATGEVRYYALPAAGETELGGLVDRMGFAVSPSLAPAAGMEGQQTWLAVPEELAQTVTEVEPPPGPYLTSPEIPGFQFKIRIAGTRLATEVPACIGETLCAAGALPDRTEVLARVLGPRPNGYLWPTFLRFTTSSVEVWVEQISTGAVRYYQLPGATEASLPGLVDRTGFLP